MVKWVNFFIAIEMLQSTRHRVPEVCFDTRRQFCCEYEPLLDFRNLATILQDYFIYLKIVRFTTNYEVTNELFWGETLCRHLVLGQNNISQTISRHLCVFLYKNKNP